MTRLVTTVDEVRQQAMAARVRSERAGVALAYDAGRQVRAHLSKAVHAQCELSIFADFAARNGSPSGLRRRRQDRPTTPFSEVLACDLHWLPDARDLRDSTVPQLSLRQPLPSWVPRFARSNIETWLLRCQQTANIAQPAALYIDAQNPLRQHVLQEFCRNMHISCELRSAPPLRGRDGVMVPSHDIAPGAWPALTVMPTAVATALAAVQAGEHSTGRLRAAVEVALARSVDLDVAAVEIIDQDTFQPVERIVAIEPSRSALVICARVGTVEAWEYAPLAPQTPCNEREPVMPSTRLSQRFV